MLKSLDMWAHSAKSFIKSVAYNLASYASNNFGNLWTRNVTNNSPDKDLIYDLPLIRLHSRELIRNNGMAASAVNTYVECVVGKGITPNSQLDFEALGITREQALVFQTAIEREWALWSDGGWCSLEGHQRFVDLQRLALRQVIENGDVFVQLSAVNYAPSPYFLKLQFIEADRVSNPTGQREQDFFSMGVERDQFTRPFRINVSRHPGGFEHKASWQPLDIYRADGWRNLLHLYDLKRPGQSRGIPLLASVFLNMKNLDAFVSAELKAAELQAYLGLYVTSSNPAGFANALTGFGGNGKSANSSLQGRTNPEDLRETLPKGVALTVLNNGEAINSVSATHPNNGFGEFVKTAQTNIAAGVGIPAEVMSKRFEASYSASRAALIEAWRVFYNQRDWLVHSFCQPVFERFLYEAVLLGRLNLDGYGVDPIKTKAWAKAVWYGESMPQLDEVKSITAAKLRMEAGITTLEQETAQLTGRDWEVNHSQRLYELEKLKRVETSTETSHQ